jgi:hypothetical protein
MSRQKKLSQWSDDLASRLPCFSRTQTRALAWWSFAIVACGCCGLSSVALFLASLLGRDENSIRERLRDLYRPANRKRGTQRRELNVSDATADLLAWCARDAKRVALALDVTNLEDRFHVLTISVLCRGGAVPVAWRVVKGNEPGKWTPY